MKNRIPGILYWISLGAALGLLVAGGGLATNWFYWGLAIAMALFDVLSRRFAWSWGPAAWLLAYVALAVNALFAGFSPAWMIAGVAAALFHWELCGAPRKTHRPADTPLSQRYERQRVWSLAIVAAIGLLLAGAGLWMRFRVTFLEAILVAGILLFSLYRLFTFSNGKK